MTILSGYVVNKHPEGWYAWMFRNFRCEVCSGPYPRQSLAKLAARGMFFRFDREKFISEQERLLGISEAPDGK